MPLQAFLHVKIDVQDIDRSLDYYCNKLQLKEIVRYTLPNGGMIVQVSPSGVPPGIELWYEKPFKGFRNDRLHMAFEVDNVAEVTRELKRKGVAIAQGPLQIGHEIIAFLRDPDGYLLELNEDTSRTT